MDSYITWEILTEYASFVTIVFMVVEFTKRLPYIKAIETRYYSALIAFVLILIVQIHGGSFAYSDIVLYLLSAISISLGSNGLSNFNTASVRTVVDKSEKDGGTV